MNEEEIHVGDAEVMMDQDPGAAAEALQVHHDVPEDQQHQVHQDIEDEDMRSPPEALAQHHQQLQASRSGPLLLRHASQSSLDESSQKFGSKAGDHKRPPYRNQSHPAKVVSQSMRKQYL